MSGRASLDNVNFTDFEKIVREMKPKIGVFGGRYFEWNKKKYTENQITKRFCDEFSCSTKETLQKAADDHIHLVMVIFEKNEQATALLKNKASCIQKTLTKIKQKCGNKQFKKHHPKFLGKEAVLHAFKEASKKFEDDIPVDFVENSPRVNIQPAFTPLEQVKKMIKEGGYLDDVWGKIPLVPEEEQKRCYFDLAEAYRMRDNFGSSSFDVLDTLCKSYIPKEYFKEIYHNLAYNSCKFAKDSHDYRYASEFIIRAGGWNPDPIFLDVAEAHIEEGELEKALEVLRFVDQKCDRTQKAYTIVNQLVAEKNGEKS